jgi:hypothetical protein
MTKQSKKAARAVEGANAEVDTRLFAGTEEIDLNPPLVRWGEVQSIRGRVVGSDIYHGEKGDKRVMLVNINGVVHGLFESAGLRRLFDQVELGDGVAVQTTGLIPSKTKPGQSLRQFKAGISHAPEAQRTHRQLFAPATQVSAPRAAPRLADPNAQARDAGAPSDDDIPF